MSKKAVYRKRGDVVKSPLNFEIQDPDTGELVKQETRTKQEFKTQCDINCVIKNYDKTGLITHVNNAKAQYGDFTAVNEYQEALNIVVDSQAAFAELPSEIRKRFNNDPGKFLEFVTDPKNIDEMVELGLAQRPKAEVGEEPTYEPRIEDIAPPPAEPPAESPPQA